MVSRISTLVIYALTNRNFATPPVELRLMKVVGEFRSYVSPEARFERYRRRNVSRTLPSPKTMPSRIAA